MMGQPTSFPRPSTTRRFARGAAIVVGVALVAGACSGSDNSSTTTTAGTTGDPVAAAKAGWRRPRPASRRPTTR